jgi:outer membrane protein assembly factor BamA
VYADGARFLGYSRNGQLYWDAGFGIRFDIDILLVRLDLGLPLYNPGNEGDKWSVKRTKFSSIIWNFGIGYPF